MCRARTIDKKKDGNQTNRRAKNSHVLFCSDREPKSGSMLVVQVLVRVGAFGVSVRARLGDRCGGPGQRRATVSQEERAKRKRAALLKVPTGQSFEVAHIGIA